MIHPWADEAAGDADPEILVMPAPNVEAVAALKPDVILGIHSGISQEEYDLPSELAPTVAQSGSTSWPRAARCRSRTSASPAATTFQTVLSLPSLIDGLVPMLAAAVDGDPATAVEPPP